MAFYFNRLMIFLLLEYNLLSIKSGNLDFYLKVSVGSNLNVNYMMVYEDISEGVYSDYF